VCGLAALALHDGDAEVTAANISALLKATNNDVAVYWPGLWANALKGDNLEKLMMTLGGGGGAAPAAAAGPAKAAAPAAKAEKPKEEEVDALDGGMNMFGGGGGGGGDY
jgi:large subunit ribosomal protein LP1